MVHDDLDSLAIAESESKRVAALLRDARSALRRIDVLAATAMATGDESVPSIAEARVAVERVVRGLSLRQLILGRSPRRRVGR